MTYSISQRAGGNRFMVSRSLRALGALMLPACAASAYAALAAAWSVSFRAALAGYAAAAVSRVPSAQPLRRSVALGSRVAHRSCGGG